MPSFCRFYYESEFAYNLSEENVLRMLESMKCHIPQSSGKKYNRINFSKNHVSGTARKIGVTFIWWFAFC